MPPYTPVTSKAQSRALFAKARDGEISMDDARGKTRAADFGSLPERVKKKSPARATGKPAGKRGKRVSARRRPR